MAEFNDPATTFGPNDGFVDELYESYLADRTSVNESWWPIFANYVPTYARTASAQPPVTPPTPPASPPPADPPLATSSPGASSPLVAAPAAPPAAAAPQTRLDEPQPWSRPGQSSQHATISRDLESSRPKLHELAEPVSAATPATAPYADRPQVLQQREPVSSHRTPLRGPAARIVTNMEASLSVPTATSVRTFPARLMIDNRILINEHLERTRGGKVSFTHLISYAIVEALGACPAMNTMFELSEGKPTMVTPEHVNLGLAIDLQRKDGSRQLLVPNIKHAEEYDFAGFVTAYQEIVMRARKGAITPDDFAGTTITVTNPGTIGTAHSIPRLMAGQAAIIGVGAMEYPAEYRGASEERLAQLAVSKVISLTSTYDHRIIQGAQSGEFLRLLGMKLLGEDGFYDRVFAALRIPYEPWRWTQDNNVDAEADAAKPARIGALIHSYRSRGHLIADTDPLAYHQRKHPDLDITNHGLTLWDLDREFPTPTFSSPRTRLREVLTVLRDAYCRTVGVEYMHIADRKQRKWLQTRLEAGFQKSLPEEQMQILLRLNEAEAFETFLQTKFVGQKRFSLEGAESLIPLLDAILSSAAHGGLGEVAIGMSHRGRLNVLSNLAGKSYAQIFREFEGIADPRSVHGSGDVKYHLGTEGIYTCSTQKVDPATGKPVGPPDTTRVTLAANPSHLEAVDAVLEGIVRAKQDRFDLGADGFTVLPILVHGDAAFAGQGVVNETLNLSALRGYRTGGTIHVVVNNQIGFTTGWGSSRSTTYCTDVAKGYQIPIFHVNGDDPEACVRVAILAFNYREEFNRDVIIDMVCYRRRGHNEGDDPSMTQPLMYNLIEGKASTRTLYTQALVARGDITAAEADAVRADFQSQLERVFTEYRPTPDDDTPDLEQPEWQREGAGDMIGWRSAVAAETLARIGRAHIRRPEGFTVHPKLEKLLTKRDAMAREGGIDWGFAEILAFGSLLIEGTPVRLAGQDSRRGTFVQRHAVIHDRHTGAEWSPLLYLTADQEKFFVIDSALSEYAALGFEYGYSVERPEALVLWEAQFGDFVNGAQTITDEFVSSAEQKWGQNSSLVMLLPHGFEGAGPDHSSARIERFLQLSAENNMVVSMPSTPANYFHLLRLQAYRRPRKPLVVFTPKSMLRLRAAASAVTDFTSGQFQTVIGDPIDPTQVRRVLMCAGKVYYDLLAARGDRKDVAIVRLEQYYPLDIPAISAALAPFGNAELVWVQDEPINQGAWQFLMLNLAPEIGRNMRVVSRPASASPSTGSNKVHVIQQNALVAAAFTLDD